MFNLKKMEKSLFYSEDNKGVTKIMLHMGRDLKISFQNFVGFFSEAL